MSHGSHDMGGWPEWLNLFLATLSGAIIGAGTCIRWMWTISDRVLTLESKVGEHSVSESLRKDRHEHIYPMLQERVILPLDMLEAEVKLHDKALTILQERTRIEDFVEKIFRRREAKGDD